MGKDHSMGGCTHIMKRHESSTLEGSRCCLIPVLSRLQECNYMIIMCAQAPEISDFDGRFSEEAGHT